MTRYVTTSIRLCLSAFIIYKIYGETGIWTTIFAICVTLGLEANALAWHVLIKKLKEII